MYDEIVTGAMFIAILTDESTDACLKSLMSTIVSFVDANGDVKERFLFFINVSEDRTASAISKHVIEIISNLKCRKKFTQCYDDAYVMTGELSGTK